MQRDIVRDAGGLQRKIERGDDHDAATDAEQSGDADRPPHRAATSAAITGNQFAYASISSGASWKTAAIPRRVGPPGPHARSGAL